MNTPDMFERQLSEILDASSGEKTEQKKISVPSHVEISPKPPVVTDVPKKRIPELLVRIAAVLAVLILLYFFGIQMAYR